jgi:DNA-binding LacI/PurR family transcriptional regulator
MDGRMAATVAQPFEAMAQEAIDLVQKIVIDGMTAEEATGGKKIIYMEAPLIDRSNVPAE